MTIKSAADIAVYYNSRPKKRAGAGVLIFNHNKQLLIVKPNYLDHWLYPGGGIEEAEPPLRAALRECKEEIGIALSKVWPAYINYQKPKPSGEEDVIQFTFTTEPVADDFLDKLTLQEDELEDAKFVDVNELSSYLSAARTKAIQTYFAIKDSRQTVYLENGTLIA